MAGEAAASRLRFFLDRGLGSRIVPEALRRAGWALETMDERYGKKESQEIKDPQWIEEASLNGDVILPPVSAIEVRVLPFAVGVHICPDGGFRLLKMADPFSQTSR